MASYSAVKICNMALTLLGAAHISALTEANEQASACNAQYEPCIDELMSRHDWVFAKSYSTLSRLSDEHDTDAYQYQLPSDCLRPLSIYGAMPQPKWFVEGEYLVCSETEVTLVYIKKVTDPSTFSDGFAHAAASLIAARISPAIIGSPSYLKEYMEMAELEYRRALQSDGMTGNDYPPEMYDPGYDPQITGRG